MNRIGAVLFACGLALVLPAGAARAASPDPKDLTVSPQELSKARALIQKLGSDSYPEREYAQAELAKMGRLAKDVLAEAATASEDPEIRLSSARLLPKAKAAHLKAQLDTFRADSDGKYEHDLPGWKVFREKFGSGDTNRALYLDILKSPYNVDLFAALDKGNAEGGRAIDVCRNRMWFVSQRFLPWNAPARRQPPLADIAALQFAEWLVPPDSIPKTGPWDSIIGQLMGEQPSAKTIESPDQPYHAVYRTIAANWIGSRTDPTEMTNIVKALNNPPFASLKESRTLLRRIVLTEGLQPVVRYQALGMLVQADWKSEPKLLRVVVKGELRVGDFPDVYPNEKDPNRTIAIRNDIPIFAGDNQLRDAALAYLVHQEKLNIRDFGFETPEGFNPSPDRPLYYNQFAFKTEERRSFGHVKWCWKLMKESMAPLASANEKGEKIDAKVLIGKWKGAYEHQGSMEFTKEGKFKQTNVNGQEDRESTYKVEGNEVKIDGPVRRVFDLTVSKLTETELVVTNRIDGPKKPQRFAREK